MTTKPDAPPRGAAGWIDRYAVIAFDLDGVLVNSFDCWWRLLNATLEEQGKAPLSRDAFARTWGQDVEADRRSFFPDWTTAHLIEHYTREFPRFARYVEPEPEAKEVLETLKRAGKRLAVASNAPRSMVETLLDRASLLPLIECAAGVDQVAAGKPAPDLLEHVLRQLGTRREDACFVGDSEYDAGAARAAGLFFVGYRRDGDCRIDSLADLIRPRP